MKFRVHPSLIVYLVLIGLVDGLSNILCILVTLITHEAGHLFVGKFFKEEYELLEITPLGGMLSYKAGYSSCKGIKGAAIAAAGPLCNIGMVYLFCILPIHHVLSKEIGTSFIGVNVSMFLINILPVLPLDGGRIVFSIGYYVFPIAQLINLLTALGCVTGVLFTALSVYGLIAIGKLNFSMLAAGGYMVLCAAKEKEILYASAFHTAIQERLDAQSFTRPIQVIAVSERECLASIIPVLCKTKKCIFIVEHHDSPQLITEKQVLGKLLASPLTTFADILSD